MRGDWSSTDSAPSLLLSKLQAVRHSRADQPALEKVGEGTILVLVRVITTF